MKNSDSLGAFLAGFLLGGFAGALIAMLTAPQSGTETRGLLREKLAAMQEELIDRPEAEVDVSGDVIGSEPFGPGGGRPTIQG